MYIRWCRWVCVFSSAWTKQDLIPGMGQEELCCLGNRQAAFAAPPMMSSTVSAISRWFERKWTDYAEDLCALEAKVVSPETQKRSTSTTHPKPKQFDAGHAYIKSFRSAKGPLSTEQPIRATYFQSIHFHRKRSKWNATHNGMKQSQLEQESCSKRRSTGERGPNEHPTKTCRNEYVNVNILQQYYVFMYEQYSTCI